MEYSVQYKLVGDNFNCHFSNGLTMTDSASVDKLTVISQAEDLTTYGDGRGHRLEAWHVLQADGTVCCKTIFYNESEAPATLEMLASFAIKNLEADRIHRMQSFWAAEGKLLSQDLLDLHMEPSWTTYGLTIEKFGQIGSMPVRKWFPFLVLENSKTGDFWGVQLYCASSWQMELQRYAGPLSVCGGLADRDYGQWMKNIAPGEHFESPKAVMACGRSLEEVCDKLVKAQHPRISPLDQDMPIMFNEFCTTWGNPTLENLTRTAERLDGSGVKFLVIDDGWHRVKEKEGKLHIGDWIPSPELFPNGIREAADMIRSHGMIPGIWYEPEIVGEASEGYQNTDHLVKRDGYPITTGLRRFWDMADPWVQDYLDERVIGLLRDNGFGYLKIDYNDNLGVGCDGAESLGEGLRQRVAGTQSFFRRLTEQLPDLVVENCSSGGHRLEPSMMELVSQASFSDAHECLSIPIIAANLHRVIRPEQSQIWAVLHGDFTLDQLRYRLCSTFLGRMCLSGAIFDLTAQQWQQAQDAMTFYHKVKHIIRDGFTSKVHCDTRSYEHPTGWQAVLRTLGDEALLVVHTFAGGANPGLTDFLAGYHTTAEYGSTLDGEFRAHAWLLHR